MPRPLSSLWPRARRRLAVARQSRRLRRRRLLRYAPFPIDLYARLLERMVSRPEAVFLPFAEGGRAGRAARVYVRHDVDLPECIERIRWLTDIDLRLGLAAAVYFRVDDEEYRLRDHARLPGELRAAGFEVGLHSVCYLDDDPFAALARDTAKFADETGFRPRTFTLHGLGAVRLDVRRRFQNELATRLEETGFEFTDCCPALRQYWHVIEDCHRTEAPVRRFVYDDFVEPGGLLRCGSDHLVLTHPCYWVA